MAYEIIWEPEGVIRQFSESVSAREFMQSVERVQGDSRYDDMRYIINDFSSASASALGEEVFTELAVLHYGAYASNPNCRVVFVTADKTLAGWSGKSCSKARSFPTPPKSCLPWSKPGTGWKASRNCT